MTFEEKVRSMTGKEIVMAMVEGLEHPVVKVRMGTYGYAYNGVCFGCAATNTVCKIAGIVFTPTNIADDKRDRAVNSDPYFFDVFERAIDLLRMGYVEYYNDYAARVAFATLKAPSEKLPILDDDNYKENLDAYRKFAEEQD